MNSDYLIIGAGIVGLSIAYSIQKREPNAKIVILEKEVEIGLHASGRNTLAYYMLVSIIVQIPKRLNYL